MLNKLSYSVTFPTTGRTLAGEFEFKPGFGLITGANEQGKSLIIEVVRWCLFGSSALRGKAEDYKTLRATLQFSARGQSYVVDRTYTTAKLMQGDAVLCIGTAPVNKHIPALLGFGLDVFDVACAANQGDIEGQPIWRTPVEYERAATRVGTAGGAAGTGEDRIRCKCEYVPCLGRAPLTATAAPPTNVTNSRRFIIQSPRRRE